MPTRTRREAAPASKVASCLPNAVTRTSDGSLGNVSVTTTSSPGCSARLASAMPIAGRCCAETADVCSSRAEAWTVWVEPSTAGPHHTTIIHTAARPRLDSWLYPRANVFFCIGRSRVGLRLHEPRDVDPGLILQHCQHIAHAAVEGVHHLSDAAGDRRTVAHLHHFDYDVA